MRGLNARRQNGGGETNRETISKSKKIGNFDNDAGYKGPNMLTMTIKVIFEEDDVREALEILKYETDAGMIHVSWKQHQKVDSSPRYLFYNVHRDTCIGGRMLVIE